jgi:predicted transcriptional regulator
MRLNQILADRLSALKDDRSDLDTQAKIHARALALHFTLSQSSIQRILRAEVHTSLDIVEQLAEIFGVHPMELLKEKTAGETSTVAPASYEEKELLKVWRKLKEETRHQAMAFMTVAAQTRRRHNDAPQHNTNEHISKVPDSSVAALKRAAGVELKPQGRQQSAKEKQESRVTARRSKT